MSKTVKKDFEEFDSMVKFLACRLNAEALRYGGVSEDDIRNALTAYVVIQAGDVEIIEDKFNGRNLSGYVQFTQSVSGHKVLKHADVSFFVLGNKFRKAASEP